jgi:sulfoxide reductase heme-binding subunit YedZ
MPLVPWLVGFLAAAWPGVRMGWDFALGIQARPYAALIAASGDWSLRLIIVSLGLPIAAALTRMPMLLGPRRMFGLFGAFYAAVHLWAWARQYGFDWAFLGVELVSRIFLFLGLLSALAIAPLAATSINRAHAWLGPARWRRVHLLIYPAAVLGLVHQILSRRYSGLEAMAMGAVIVAAFIWRLIGPRFAHSTIKANTR